MPVDAPPAADHIVTPTDDDDVIAKNEVPIYRIQCGILLSYAGRHADRQLRKAHGESGAYPPLWEQALYVMVPPRELEVVTTQPRLPGFPAWRLHLHLVLPGVAITERLEKNERNEQIANQYFRGVDGSSQVNLSI